MQCRAVIFKNFDSLIAIDPSGNKIDKYNFDDVFLNQPNLEVRVWIKLIHNEIMNRVPSEENGLYALCTDVLESKYDFLKEDIPVSDSTFIMNINRNDFSVDTFTSKNTGVCRFGVSGLVIFYKNGCKPLICTSDKFFFVGDGRFVLIDGDRCRIIAKSETGFIFETEFAIGSEIQSMISKSTESTASVHLLQKVPVITKHALGAPTSNKLTPTRGAHINELTAIKCTYDAASSKFAILTRDHLAIVSTTASFATKIMKLALVFRNYDPATKGANYRLQFSPRKDMLIASYKNQLIYFATDADVTGAGKMCEFRVDKNVNLHRYVVGRIDWF